MSKKEITKSLCGYPAALNVKETAEILRVSTKTVYKLIAEGKLPAVKVGRENRIAKSELIKYKSNQRGHFFRQKNLRIFEAVGNHFPQTIFFIETKFNRAVINIPSGAVERGAVLTAAAYV